MLDDKLLDVSQYDAATWNAQCIYDSGVRNVIFGTFSRVPAPPNGARLMANEWVRVGGTVYGFYGLVYFGGGSYVLRDCNWAIQLAQEFGVQNVMMDAEIDATEIGVNGMAPSPDMRNAELRMVRRRIEDAGLQPWVYTYQNWWVEKHANSNEFADLPLWFARYGRGGAPIPPVPMVSFGGWHSVAVHQYTSTVERCGRVRDHNYLFREEGGMSSQEYDRLVKAIFGDEDRMAVLESLEAKTLEARVSQFEANDGPIGARLADLEAAKHSHDDGSTVADHQHGGVQR